jgi:hypothetical protein
MTDEWEKYGTPVENDAEFGWDDAIENDGPQFVILPEGDYDFEVIDFERGRHNGSEKLPPCNKAIVHIRIQGKEGQTIIKHQLFLHTRTEGMLCAFFTAIGQRKHGERVTMKWDKVIGSKGRCKVYVDEWTGKEGKPMKSNKIQKFCEPEDAPAPFKAGTF